jgi:hypothetical protein
MPSDDDNVLPLFGEGELPYGGSKDPNSGWTGSETSHDRAHEADHSGLTGVNQRRSVTELHRVGERGLTWKELSAVTGWHHGTSSGVLSVLHKTGRIARLTMVRNRCKVYVLPEFAAGRDTERTGKTSQGHLLTAAMTFIESLDPQRLTLDQSTQRRALLARRPRERNQ